MLSVAHAARSLRPPPISINAVLKAISASQETALIQEMARAYLPPEQLDRVLDATGIHQTTVQFLCAFSEHVFPIQLEYMGIDTMAEDLIDYGEDDPYLPDLNEARIPYAPCGLDLSYELHELTDMGQPAFIAIAFFTNFLQLEPSSPSYHQNEDSGFRAVWADYLTNRYHVQPRLLQGTPPHGYPLSLMKTALRNSKHHQAMNSLELLTADTDNIFLGFYFSEMNFDYLDPWSDDCIRFGIEQWSYARTILEGHRRYCDRQEARIPKMVQEIRRLINKALETKSK